MNSWQVAKDRSKVAKREARYRIDFAIELKALNAEDNRDSQLIMARVQGQKRMMELTHRGWKVMSHSPSNYAHAMNMYVMIIDRPVLEKYLTNAKAALGLA